MKSVWVFFLLAPLFNKYNCSIESNAGNQPLSLLKSAFQSLAKWQIGKSLSKEPFVAYNKLKSGTLEIFGTAFGEEVTSEKILFLQKVTSNFKIHSVVFKWFYFDEKMLRIFDIFHKKLQNSVNSVTFEKCFFPKTLVFKSFLELNCVTDCSFIQCFANEESFKEMFKILKNASVASLIISQVFDCNQHESIDTSVGLKEIFPRNVKRKLMKINDLKLDSFFPNIRFLSLMYCSIDFDHFDLKSLKNLDSVDLNLGFECLCVEKLLECLPTNVKCIKVSDLFVYHQLNFTENASVRKIIVDTACPVNCDEIGCTKALSVFSSIYFNMYRINDKMTIIKEYVDSNRGDINTVTSVRFDMVFNYQSITNVMTLLTYFPNIDEIKIFFYGDCDASINDDEIRQLFSTLSIRKVKKLSMKFYQSNETTTFYCFIVELLKLYQKMSILEFYYEISNSLAINIKEMVERENIQFSNLNTFLVDYWSGNIDISVDLFYVAKYKIKKLTLNIGGSIQNLNGLDKFECFSVDYLNFYICCASKFKYFIKKLFTKFPHVKVFNWDSDLYDLISSSVLQNMKGLKKVTVKYILSVDSFIFFSTLLPHDLESLEIKYFPNELKEIEEIFYERFPTATLKVN